MMEFAGEDGDGIRLRQCGSMGNLMQWNSEASDQTEDQPSRMISLVWTFAFYIFVNSFGAKFQATFIVCILF